MHISPTIFLRFILKPVTSLHAFVFSRPRIDIDLVNNPAGLFGQRNLGASSKQDYPEPIDVTRVKYDFELYWDYIIRIKNNSSKTAYSIRIEKIYKLPNDYLSKIDPLASLKDSDTIELEYRLKHYVSDTGNELKAKMNKFPWHMDKIEVILSYTNEARKKFYTKFTATKNNQINEHLIFKPKKALKTK